MATFDFKSIGKSFEAAIKSPVTGSLIPIGVKTPLRRGGSNDGIFAMNYSYSDQLHDNLKNLLMTNHGERLGQYEFGADIKPLMSELVSQDNFEVEVMRKINDAVSKYMPYVSLKTFEKKIDQFNNEHVGQIVIRLTYDVPLIGVIDRPLELLMSVM